MKSSVFQKLLQKRFGLQPCKFQRSGSKRDWWYVNNINADYEFYINVFNNTGLLGASLNFTVDDPFLRVTILSVFDEISRNLGKSLFSETIWAERPLIVFASPFQGSTYSATGTELEFIEREIEPLLKFVSGKIGGRMQYYQFLTQSSGVFSWRSSMPLFRFCYLAILAKELGVESHFNEFANVYINDKTISSNAAARHFEVTDVEFFALLRDHLAVVV